MDATVNSTFSGSTSGAQTSLSVSVTVPANTRMLVMLSAEAGLITAPFVFSSVKLGTTTAIRLYQEQGWSWKEELWGIDSPSTSETSVSIVAPSAVKFGVTIVFLNNARPLSFAYVKFDGSTVNNPNVTESLANVAIPNTPSVDLQFLELSLVASTANAQTFTAVSPLTGIFAQNGVGNTNVHQALGSNTVARFIANDIFGTPLEQWTLGTAAIWSGMSVVIAGEVEVVDCIPTISNMTNGNALASWNHTSELGKTLFVYLRWLTFGPATVTFNGVALTPRLTNGAAGANFHSVEIFVLENPPVGTFAINVTAGFGLVHCASWNVANCADGANLAGMGFHFNAFLGNTTQDMYGMGYDTNSLMMGFFDSFGGGTTYGVSDGTEHIAGTGFSIGSKLCDGGRTKMSFTSGGDLHEQVALLFNIPSVCSPVSGGSLQWWSGHIDGLTTSQLRFTLPRGDIVRAVTDRPGNQSLPLACTLRNMVVDLETAPGIGNSRIFTVWQNGAPTTMTGTVSGTNKRATLSGELKCYRFSDIYVDCTVTGAPPNSDMSYSLECETAEPAESVYAMGGYRGLLGPGLAQDGRANPFGGITEGGGSWDTAEYRQGRVGCAGRIKSFCFDIDTLMDGSIYHAYLYKSTDDGATFVKQDGSGGTPNTQMIISNATGSHSAHNGQQWYFEIPIVPLAIGDQVYVNLRGIDNTGSKLGHVVNMATVFEAATDGEFMITGEEENVNQLYHPPDRNTNNNGYGLEADAVVKVGPLSSPLVIEGETWAVKVGPGVGQTRTLYVRKNSANSIIGPATITGTTVRRGSASGPVTFADGDTIAVVPGEAFTTQINWLQSWWALRGSMDPGAVTPPDDGNNKITQLLVLVSYNADDDEDQPPSASACDGGGVLPTVVNPTADPSLATATEPHVWVEITPIGGETLKYSHTTLPHGIPRYGKVKTMGSIKTTLCDADHGHEATVVTTTLIDIDGALRALGPSLKNALVEYYVSDYTTIKADGTPRREFRGLLDSWSPDSDLEFTITSVDIFTARLTSIDADALQTPVVLLDGSIVDQNPLQKMFDKPVPEHYGSFFDEEEGAWEFKHIANITLPGFEGLGNAVYFLGGLGAWKKIQSIYGADIASGDPPTRRIQLPASAFGDWRVNPLAYLIVHKMTGALGDYFDFGGHRYMVLIAKDGHPVVKLAMEGRIPFTGNFCSREDVGDASGLMYNSIPRALYHWINNGVLQFATGNWLTNATYGDYTILNKDSFETVHDRCDLLGYRVGVAIGGNFSQQDWRDEISSACRSGGFDFYVDRHGRGSIHKLDTTASGIGVKEFTRANILDGTVRNNMRLDAVENIVRYVYGRNYVTALADLTPEEGSRLFKDPFEGEWKSGLRTLTNSVSIDDLGGNPKGIRRSRVQEYFWTRDQITADSVAVERMNLRSPAGGRNEPSFDVLYKDGCDVEMGDIISAEHWDFSWTGLRRCEVRQRILDMDELTITFVVRDNDNILAGGIVVDSIPLAVSGDTPVFIGPPLFTNPLPAPPSPPFPPSPAPAPFPPPPIFPPAPTPTPFPSPAPSAGGIRPQMPPAFGMQGVFGRGDGSAVPKVYIINTLSENDPAVLVGGTGTVSNPYVYHSGIRACCEASGPRFGFFIGSGVIQINSPIFILHPYLTLSGAVAVSPGITLRAGDFTGSGQAGVIEVNTHDVMFSHFRVRGGDVGYSNIGCWEEAFGTKPYNVVFDHISASWGEDENFYCTGSDVTFWRCLSGESLLNKPGGEVPSAGHGIIFGSGQVGNGVSGAVIGCLLHSCGRGPEIHDYIDVFVGDVLNSNGCGPSSANNPAASLWYQSDGGASRGTYVNFRAQQGPDTPNGYAAIQTYYSVNGTQLYLEDCTVTGTYVPFVHGSIDPRVATPPVPKPLRWVSVGSSALRSWIADNVGARPLDRDAVDTRYITEMLADGGDWKSSVDESEADLAVNPQSDPTLPTDAFVVVDSQGHTNFELWLEGYAQALEG